MDSVSYTIVISVISGVITSGIIWFAVSVFNKIIIPWWMNLKYTGVRIDGKWEGGTTTPNNKIKASIQLTQKASEICGIFSAETINLKDPNTKYSNQYKITGSIMNNIIRINYGALSNQKTGMGVGQFEINKGGNSLCGQIIHSENSSDKSFYFKDFVLDRKL